MDMDLIVNQVFVTIDMIVVGGTLLGAIHLVGRRRHQLKLKQEERRLIEARTIELAEQHRLLELEYRLGRAEPVRSDQRTTRDIGATPQGG